MADPATTADDDHPRGPGVRLSAGDYSAEIGEVGAALRRLHHRDRPLTYGFDTVIPTPPYAGAVLAPWPNRVAAGRYDFDGQQLQLPINEVDLGNALHGLALWERWSLTGRSAASATFEHLLWPRPGYPFTVALQATYELDGDGLRITLSAGNRGPQAAPVGLSAHPYFTVGAGSIDEWTLTLPCAQVVLTDERLWPTGVAGVEGTGFDFRAGRPIADTALDHAFTGIAFGPDGGAAAELTGPDGTGVRLSWDAACQWLQVYTMHAPGTDMHRRTVAIEPMTCAPDAFNSGAGLIVLAPGATTSVSMRVSAVGS